MLERAARIAADPGVAALTVRELTVSYAGEHGRTDAVVDVSLQVRAGEVHGLVGESGSGKSTVARAVAGLLGRWGRVGAGSIAIDGQEVANLSESARARLVRAGGVSIVFQDPLNALDPVRRIGPQVAEAIRLRGRGPARGSARGAVDGRGTGRLRDAAEQILARVQIDDPPAVMRLYPHELSGGMRQRVVIGMAVAGAPKVLIADEPTTALDVITQRSLVELLKGLVATSSTALLFITHNLALASEICDTVSVMYAGKIVEQGRCREVVRDPGHPYTQGLVTAIPRLRGEFRTVAGIPGTPYAAGGDWQGCAFRERCYLGRDRARCRDKIPVLDGTAGAPGRAVRCHFTAEASTQWRTKSS